MVKFYKFSNSYRYLAAFLPSPVKVKINYKQKKPTEASASVCLILAKSLVFSTNFGLLTAVFQKKGCLMSIAHYPVYFQLTLITYPKRDT